MTHLTQQDCVYLLTLGNDENRFSVDWLEEVNTHLDEVVAAPSPPVTTASGKFYSNGLDLDYVMSKPDRLPAYVAEVHALFARVLALPVPTVAAVPRHAFGAGAMLAMAHDRRIMRHDRGYFCFPEVHINPLHHRDGGADPGEADAPDRDRRYERRSPLQRRRDTDQA